MIGFGVFRGAPTTDTPAATDDDTRDGIVPGVDPYDLAASA